MKLGTIQCDSIVHKDIPEEFVDNLYNLGESYRPTVVNKSTIECHLEDIKPDSERREELRSKYEPWRAYLQGIFDEMKSEYLLII